MKKIFNEDEMIEELWDEISEMKNDIDF